MVAKKNRAYLIAVGVIIAMGCIVMSGCTQQAEQASWMTNRDESLGLLAENDDVIAETAWLEKPDGSIQLQFAAGSIPEPRIESVQLDGEELKVTMAIDDGPATMDFHLHQFILTPPQGTDACEVKKVIVSTSGADLPAKHATTTIEQ